MSSIIIPDFTYDKYTFTEVNSGEMECYYATPNVFMAKHNDKVIPYRFGMYVNVDYRGDILIKVYAIPTFDIFNSNDIVEIIEYGTTTFGLDIKHFIETYNTEAFYDVPIMMTNDDGYDKAFRLVTGIHNSDKELFNKAKRGGRLSDNTYYLGVMNHYVNSVFDFPSLELGLSKGTWNNELAKIAKIL